MADTLLSLLVGLSITSGVLLARGEFYGGGRLTGFLWLLAAGLVTALSVCLLGRVQP